MQVRQSSHYLPGGGGRRAHVGLLLSAVRDELVWIDCEMTGLDLRSDKLIEIAVLVTDADLNILGDGIDVVIHADDAALSSMIEVVADMHSRSGLIDEVKASVVDMATAETMVLDYIGEHVKQPKTAPLAGNSIATDRSFIARDMPKLDSFLHYRMIDVSSIKELCRRWYPRIYFGQPAKGLTHRALADIHESSANCSSTGAPHSCPSQGRLPAKSRLWPPNYRTGRTHRNQTIRPTSYRAASIDVAARWLPRAGSRPW